MNVRKPTHLLLLFLGFILLFFVSCGYRFSETQKVYKTLAVPVMENMSGETGISAIITNSFISEMMRFHGVKIADPETADCVLRGVITNVTFRTVVRETSHLTEAREVVVSIDLTLKNREGKTVWAVKSMTDSELYYVRSEKELLRSAILKAVEKLARRMAERAALSIGSNF